MSTDCYLKLLPAAKIPGAYEKTKKDEYLAKKGIIPRVYEPIVSDDDVDDAKKKVPKKSGASDRTTSMIDCEYSSGAWSSSDDETTIESDQPLFLDDIPEVKHSNISVPQMDVEEVDFLVEALLINNEDTMAFDFS